MTTTTKKQKRYSKKIPIHQRPGPFNWVTGGQQQVDSCCDLHSVLLLLLVPLLYHLLFSLNFRFVAPHYSPPPRPPHSELRRPFLRPKSQRLVAGRVLPSFTEFFFINILHPGWPRLRRTTITDVFIFHPLGSFDLFYLFRIVSRFVFSHIFSENLKKTKFFSSCDELPIFRRFHVARLVFPLIFVVFFVFFKSIERKSPKTA